MSDEYFVKDARVMVRTNEQIVNTDAYRLPEVGIIFIAFLTIVILLGRFKGLGAIIGMFFSLGILGYFMVPQILAGHDPFLISLISAFIIAIVSLYIAHGFNKKTTISLISTLFTLTISSLLSVAFVNLTKLTGTGSEEAVFLRIGYESLNLKGLLLGGIVVGALGVLDDITTAQVAIVDELKKANSKLGFKKLFFGAMSVGQEHIASLVNTLVLAYAGSSLPLFLLFYQNQYQPSWVILNSEFIVEEIIRTLVGSITLVLAVPISSFLAALAFEKGNKNSN